MISIFISPLVAYALDPCTNRRVLFAALSCSFNFCLDFHYIYSSFQNFHITSSRTVGGLTKASLMKTKSGKIVSSKKSALAKKGKIGKWAKAFVAARKALGVKGFVACKKGSALYKKTLSFYKK